MLNVVHFPRMLDESAQAVRRQQAVRDGLRNVPSAQGRTFENPFIGVRTSGDARKAYVTCWPKNHMRGIEC